MVFNYPGLVTLLRLTVWITLSLHVNLYPYTIPSRLTCRDKSDSVHYAKQSTILRSIWPGAPSFQAGFGPFLICSRLLSIVELAILF